MVKIVMGVEAPVIEDGMRCGLHVRQEQFGPLLQVRVHPVDRPVPDVGPPSATWRPRSLAPCRP